MGPAALLAVKLLTDLLLVKQTFVTRWKYAVLLSRNLAEAVTQLTMTPTKLMLSCSLVVKAGQLAIPTPIPQKKV